MNVIDQAPQPGVGVEHPSHPESCLESTNAGGDATALKGIFRLLCGFSGYLLLVDLLSDTTSMSNLVEALLRFIPFCVFLVVVVILARPVVKLNKATLLMALFLVCIFVVFLLGLTRHLPSLSRNDAVGLAPPFVN